MPVKKQDRVSQDAHALAQKAAPEFSAAGRNLQGVQFGLAQPLGPIRNQRAVRRTGHGIFRDAFAGGEERGRNPPCCPPCRRASGNNRREADPSWASSCIFGVQGRGLRLRCGRRPHNCARPAPSPGLPPSAAIRSGWGLAFGGRPGREVHGQSAGRRDRGRA